MATLQALPGIPPNFSVMAALSAGLLPANGQITNFSAPNQTVLSVLSAAGANGNAFSPALNGSQNDGTANGNSGGAGAVELQHNALESALTFASPLVYGGN